MRAVFFYELDSPMHSCKANIQNNTMRKPTTHEPFWQERHPLPTGMRDATNRGSKQGQNQGAPYKLLFVCPFLHIITMRYDMIFNGEHIPKRLVDINANPHLNDAYQRVANQDSCPYGGVIFLRIPLPWWF